MSYQNIILLIAAGVNLLMSILVFARGVKNNKINLYFSLLTFFNFLWASGLFAMNQAITEELTKFFAAFVYPISIIIVTFLFLFINNYPFQSNVISRKLNNFLLFSVAWPSVYCLLFYKKFVLSVQVASGDNIVASYDTLVYTFFSINFLVISTLVVKSLWGKYNNSESFYKNKLKLLLVAVVIGLSAGIFLNLLSYYFTEQNFYNFGPLFTLLINFVVFYFIVSSLEKNNAQKK